MQGNDSAHVLVDIGSSLNVLPKKDLDRLDCEGLTLKPNNIVVRAFDGSKRMVHGEVDVPKSWFPDLRLHFLRNGYQTIIFLLVGMPLDTWGWGCYFYPPPNDEVPSK